MLRPARQPLQLPTATLDAVDIAVGDNREVYGHWAKEIEEGEPSMVEHEIAGHE